jgi:tetratricopeptide (TPR) repeat protein
VAIRGSLTEASLPDVLQLLSMGKKTGCLGLTHGNSFGYIYFRDGLISHASIVNRSLGTEEAVYVLFTWTHGTFNFEPGVTPDEGVEILSIDPQGLMLEGARRVDEWALIAKKIPTFDIVFSLDRQKLLGNERSLTDDQKVLVELIDGSKDVRTLVALSNLSEFAVGKALYGLLNAEYIVRAGVAARVHTQPQPNDRIAEHRNLGIAFYKTGMYEEAAREFRRVDSLRKDDPVASFYLGLVALRQQRWASAVREFERHLQQSMPRAGAYVNLAYAYERMGDIAQAQAAMEKALAQGGRNDPIVQTNAAALAIAVRDHEAADLALATAKTLWGTRLPPPAWYHYAGLNAALTNDLERAIAVLTEAVHTYPNYAVLWNNLALAYEARGELDEALRTVERGLVEDSTLPQLHRNFADCLHQNGRLDEAHEAYRRVRAMDGSGL